MRRLLIAACLPLVLAMAAAGAAHAAEPPAPEIMAVSPDHGPLTGGTTVVIEGEHFTGVSAVHFSGIEAESFTVDSDTEITTVAPTFFVEPTRGFVMNLWVTGPGGSSNNWVRYSYGPVITEIAPERGPASGGTAVTIVGQDLGETSAVTFGSVPAESFTVNSDESITAISPPVAPEESIIGVTATTPEGTSGVDWSSPDEGFANTFTYGPTVTRVIPDMGPEAGAGTTVTILGTGFLENAFRCLCGPFVGSLMFGDVELRCGFPFGAGTASCRPLEFVVDSDREITAIVPPGHGTVTVAVRTAGGKSPASPEAQFTYPPDGSPPGGSEEPPLLELMSCVVATRVDTKAIGVCSSRSLTSDEEAHLSAGPVKASLYRGKTLYATGTARVHRQTAHLFLKPVNPVKGGRYELVLSRPATDRSKRWSRREPVVLH